MTVERTVGVGDVAEIHGEQRQIIGITAREGGALVAHGEAPRGEGIDNG